MSDLHGLGAAAIARLVKQREVSAEEVVKAHLARLRRLEPSLEAFLHVDEEDALARARRVDGL
ncbi:MAG TPA: Asp-tRNA(Asn)/Glu-tRNA(Gln) amidotransferase GatCAB subunit A, partial [Vicinamibacteria bacterium]|nr:Asp-tRNA(Asn)/Glu-tRNA(Gln) amidotransferase GatCAB subunit A [Vicinamibacteria bacterium]